MTAHQPPLTASIARFFKSKQPALMLSVWLLLFVASPSTASAAVILVVDGRATALATDYTTAGGSGANAWTAVTDATSAGTHTNSRTGTFMQYLPDTGAGGSPTGGPFLTYEIQVTTPGQYQLYVSWDVNNTNSGTVGSSDSYFTSIAQLVDGTGSTGGPNADWYEISQKNLTNDGDFNTTRWMSSGEAEVNAAGAASNPLIWNIATAGTYTLRFSPREDGVAIDQFVFQLSSMEAPTGFPPITTTPEPGRFLLLGIGLAAVLSRRSRR